MPVHDFDTPDRFVVGTVGPPGQRTFLVQARAGGRIVSASCEKEQLIVLADRMVEVLADIPGIDPASAPADNDPLDTPIEDEFRVASLTLGWDAITSRMVLEFHDSDPEDDGTGDADDMPDDLAESVLARTSIRVALTPSQAREFARRTAALAAAGRPQCPFCGGPLDPNGHVCPRANGYRR